MLKAVTIEVKISNFYEMLALANEFMLVWKE
jgi:hypothetical protein